MPSKIGIFKQHNGTNWDELYPKTIWSQVEDKPTNYPPSAHTHDEYLKKTGGTLTGPLYINRDNYSTKPALLINKSGTVLGIGAYNGGNNIRYGATSGNDWVTAENFNHYFDGTIYENGTSLASKYLGINAVSDWAKASTKPSYAWNEITDKPSVATLDTNGKVPSSQLPSYVDDVLEYTAKANFPSTGETGKIYVDNATNLTYRWSGSAYVEISPSLALGTTSSTAFRGDYGNSAYTHAVTNKGSAFASGLYKITTNSEGHVTAATAVVKADITSLGIPGSDTNTWRPIAINGAVKVDDRSTNLNFVASGSASVAYDEQTKSVVINATDTNTKNTAGSTDTSSKIFLIGATSQAANPQTYSDNEVFATSGVLSAKSFNLAPGATSKATIQYNTAEDCIDFIFS